nr:hypothetical protein [Tanacetum cinerariifolium]
MIQAKEMMQDKDLKNSKLKDEGSRSRSRSMNDQSHYKQEKTKTRPKKEKLKRHIFNSGEDKFWDNTIPLSDDPIRTVSQSHLVDTDIESGPLEDLRETEIPNHYLVHHHLFHNRGVKASKPSDTRITSSHSMASSDSTTPLSPDYPLSQTSPALTRASYYCSTARMAVRTQSTLSLCMSARNVKAAALSPASFRKRYRSLIGRFPPFLNSKAIQTAPEHAL